MSETTVQTHVFKTEIKQLFDLDVGHLYSNPDAFTELISNAIDANDKQVSLGLENDAFMADDPELKIWVEIDSDAKVLIIRDNGIGMSKQEVADHLGTIACSAPKFSQSVKRKECTRSIPIDWPVWCGFLSCLCGG